MRRVLHLPSFYRSTHVPSGSTTKPMLNQWMRSISTINKPSRLNANPGNTCFSLIGFQFQSAFSHRSFSSAGDAKKVEDDIARERRVAEERSRKHEFNEDLLQNRALIPNKLSWNAVARALIGNLVITALKFGVYVQTGSAAMLSEAVHTLADCGNQILLLKGLQQSSQTPDKRHQYGYGKASFFWALVSALGMFWTGAGVSFGHGLYTLIHPPEMFHVSREMLGVLFVSFLVDGFVLTKTLREVAKSKPKNISYLKHLTNVRDPFILAVLFEDAAACTGVAVAAGGIYLTQLYGDVSYDTLAGISVGLLLGGVAIKLVQINHQFLLGQAVDEDIVADIRNILRSRPAINAVYDIQSEWIAPHAFSFKAECDFNGYELGKRLQDIYSPLYLEAANKPGSNAERKHEIETIMSWMAEDVTRLIEQEVKQVETIIRTRHPMAAFIELEPDSKKSYLRAYDGRAWKESDSPLISSVRREGSSLLPPQEMSFFGSDSEPAPAVIKDGDVKREAAFVITQLLKRKLSFDVENEKDANKK